MPTSLAPYPEHEYTHRQAERIDPRIEQFAHWLDSRFSIPGTNIRFGLDAILGLFPAVGDFLPAIAALYILFAAAKQGVPRSTLARMAANIAFDYVVGAVPVAGDVFDVFWKANDRNAALLAKHVNAAPEEQAKVRRGDRLFVVAVVAGLVAILGVSVAASWFGFYLLAKLLAGAVSV